MIVSRVVLGLVVGVSTAGVAAGIGVLAATPRGLEPVGFQSEMSASSTPTSGAGPYARPPAVQDPNAPYDGQYHFARVRFSPGGRGSFGGFGRGRGRGGAMWAHDYPRADFNFLAILRETTFVRTHRAASNVVAFDDPEIFRYPISYIVEVGAWNPTDEETVALGEYLLKGGFLIVDDFRGPYELDNLAFHLKRALPDHSLLPVAEDDDIFDSFFRIAPNDVVPPYGGYPPLWYGIYEDNDPEKRIMVMINANNDMAEYWEFSDYGYYPIDLANEAYKLGVNYVVYALTH